MINYHIMDNAIVISHEGDFYNISSDDTRYEPLYRALVEGDLSVVPDLLAAKAKPFLDAGLELRDGELHLDGESFADTLADRVVAHHKEGLPTDRLVKLARRIRKNSSYNSRTMLYSFLEHNGHPITEDGCFIAYRGVTADFLDKHTRSFDNSVGSVCEMPRDKVDDNPNNTCSAGLHVACYDYANGFGDAVVEVKVRPEDVVCVPTDYNGTKMRTCRFEVVAVNKQGALDGLTYDTTQADGCGYSSVIKNISYDDYSEELTVEFHSGNTYVYDEMCQDIYDDFFNADSWGKYFNEHIKDQYNCRRVS